MEITCVKKFSRATLHCWVTRKLSWVNWYCGKHHRMPQKAIRLQRLTTDSFSTLSKRLNAQARAEICLSHSPGAAKLQATRTSSSFYIWFTKRSGEWWGYDQEPLGARLPTRMWYAGLTASETWHVPLPTDLDPGRYGLFTGLYRLRDLERMPATSIAGDTFFDARVPLGSLVIE